MQKHETYLPTSTKVFAAFEAKFIALMPLLNYYPFFEQLLLKGIETLVRDNYSAIELRMVLGLGEIVDENFKVISDEEIIDRLVKISNKFKKKYNLSKI